MDNELLPYEDLITFANILIKENIHPQIITLLIFKLNIKNSKILLSLLPDDIREDVLVNRLVNLKKDNNIIDRIGEVLLDLMMKKVKYRKEFFGKDKQIKISPTEEDLQRFDEIEEELIKIYKPKIERSEND